MNNKKVTMNFLFILTIIVFFSIYNSTAQVNPVNYGAIYNVSIGQTMEYKITKSSPSSALNRPLGNILLPNDTDYMFNESLGTTFTVTVVNKNISSGLPQAYCNISIFNRTHDEIASLITNQTGFLNYAFPNFASQKSYINDQMQFYNNISNSIAIESLNYLSQDGNYFNENLSVIVSSSTYITVLIKSNWKTGWLSSSEVIIATSNGTIISDVQEQLLNNSGFNTPLSSGNINILLLYTVVGVLAVFVILVFSYASYRRSSNNSKNNFSFRTYLSEKVHFNQKNKKRKDAPQVQPLKTDKSFKMIEEILQETENQ